MVNITEKNAAGQEVTRAVNKLIELELGIILGSLFSFMVTAAVVFFVIVKPMNKLVELTQGKKEPEPAPEIPADIQLLTEIRDLLKNKST